MNSFIRNDLGPSGAARTVAHGGTSRRDLLARAGAGFGLVALAGLLAEESPLGGARALGAPAVDPLAPRAGHLPARADRIIFLFMDGGPSHIDTFDFKPRVNELAGKPLPQSVRRVITPMGVSESPLLPCKRAWRPCGESGLYVSDWYPHVGRVMDELCVIHSCRSNALNHVGGVCQMNTGSILAGRPSLGAWVNYGLGSENRNLPGFVVLLDNDREPPGGPRVWSTGFMPSTFQGTRFRGAEEPILHLRNPAGVSDARQRRKHDLLLSLDRAHAERHPGDDSLEARIAAYELAFRMQADAPEAVDISQETAETQSLYGLDDPATAPFGRNALLARRLVERGVRFVQLYAGSGSKWDAHSGLEQNHAGLCRATDKPIAGLITDLKRRGLLERTLVLWGGEFGRTPMSEKGTGRDHNPYGFTMWLAGGGVRGGRVVGATDEFGLHAVERPVHVHDLHATLLHLLGVDHERLIYQVGGRPERLTMNEGAVVDEIVA